MPCLTASLSSFLHTLVRSPTELARTQVERFLRVAARQVLRRGRSPRGPSRSKKSDTNGERGSIVHLGQTCYSGFSRGRRRTGPAFRGLAVMNFKTPHLGRAGAALASVLLLGGLAYWALLRPPAFTPAALERRWARLGAARPNVVLVTLDTTRADHLGCYGYPQATTPNLDALARHGVVFAHASSVAPLTLPAHSSILTGMQPTFHGVRVNGSTALGQSQDTLAEVLSAKGYQTGAFVGAFVLDGRWGLNQGFDHYDDRFDLKKYKHLDLAAVQRPGNEVDGRGPRLAGEPQAGSFLRLDPSLRRALSLRASRAVPLEVPGTRSRRPLRRRDRFRRRAGRPARRLAAGRSDRPEDRARDHRRPRRGARQPRRGNSRVFRVRLRHAGAVPGRDTVRGAPRDPDRLTGELGRPVPDRPRAGGNRRRAEGAGSLPASGALPSPGPGRELRLFRVDDPEPPVRMGCAPQPALDAVQADPGAPPGALRPRDGPGRGDERVRPQPRGGQPSGREARAAHGRDRPGCAVSGVGGSRP